MKSLNTIFLETGTDKASSHPLIAGHNYAIHYDAVFTPMRELPIKLIEIGVGGAESIRGWLEYFSAGKIFGVDNVHSTNPYNTVGSGVHERYTFITGDQSDPTMWKCFLADHGTDFDILIDDGGHCANQIITTFKGMWPAIKPGGFYCIEDMNTAYAIGTHFCPAGWQNHMDFVKDKLDEINRSQSNIESLFFTKELAIFRKAK